MVYADFDRRSLNASYVSLAEEERITRNSSNNVDLVT